MGFFSKKLKESNTQTPQMPTSQNTIVAINPDTATPVDTTPIIPEEIYDEADTSAYDTEQEQEQQNNEEEQKDDEMEALEKKFNEEKRMIEEKRELERKQHQETQQLQQPQPNVMRVPVYLTDGECLREILTRLDRIEIWASQLNEYLKRSMK